MRSAVALLAAVLAAALGGCGDGAEPGASREATLVLDYQPNAVHAGIYAALEAGLYEAEGVELEVREPTASTDAPRLLEAGRAELAIMTIGDVGVALERGVDLRPVAQIVRRPLGAVIAADRDAIREPSDLEGATIGVTGVPSDDAVLDAVLASGGVDPGDVERISIGFDSVAALSAGRIDAATAFWNAEGVLLRRLGVPIRELRFDEHGAGRHPELLLVASGPAAREDPALIEAVFAATESGYRTVVERPDAALDALVAGAPGLDRAEQAAQLDALLEGRAFGDSPALEPQAITAWLRFASEHGVVDPELVRPQLAIAIRESPG